MRRRLHERTEKNPTGAGRIAHAPTMETRRQVESMAGFGIPQEDIARSLGMVIRTLKKFYKVELATGSIKANAAVAQNLFRRATSEDSQSVSAAIFWLKTRAGWKETVVQEHAGKVVVRWLPAT